MAGHNKWSSIKHKKDATDAKRGKIFSKIGKEISVAVKIGGLDPSSNPRLRSAIISAKAINMPNDNVDRAIKKGSGDNDGNDYEELSYEGYAVEGVAVVVDCLSNNRNRTASEIRSIFGKNNGNLGVTGAVLWIFHHKSQFIIEGKNADEELLIEIVLDEGAEEIIIKDNIAEIIAPIEAFDSIQKALEKAQIKTTSAQITKLPKNNVNVTDSGKAKQILRLINTLEDNDDVQNIYANFTIDESIIKEVMEV